MKIKPMPYSIHVGHLEGRAQLSQIHWIVFLWTTLSKTHRGWCHDARHGLVVLALSLQNPSPTTSLLNGQYLVYLP